jgi:hypothetical protein
LTYTVIYRILSVYSSRKEDEAMSDFEQYLQYEKEVAQSRLRIIDRFQKEGREKPVKRTSMISVVEQVLKHAGRPLHVSEIIETAKREYGAELSRDSLVSFMIKRMNAGRTFIRTAPNTFTVKEEGGTE